MGQYILIASNLLEQQDVQLIWGTGNADYEKAVETSKVYKERVWLRPYIDDMPLVYQASDLVICRAGAIALSEIEMYGIPAILVPYPFAAAGHQEWNAKALVEQGAAKMLLDSELAPDYLLSEVNFLFDDEKLLKKMRGQMLKLARPEATEKIVNSILALAAHRDSRTENVGRNT